MTHLCSFVISVFSGSAAAPTACCVCQRVSGSRQPCVQCERSACPACTQQCSSCSSHCCSLCAVTEWVSEWRACVLTVLMLVLCWSGSKVVLSILCAVTASVTTVSCVSAVHPDHKHRTYGLTHGCWDDVEDCARRDFNSLPVKCKWDDYFYILLHSFLYLCIYSSDLLNKY